LLLKGGRGSRKAEPEDRLPVERRTEFLAKSGVGDKPAIFNFLCFIWDQEVYSRGNVFYPGSIRRVSPWRVSQNRGATGINHTKAKPTGVNEHARQTSNPRYFAPLLPSEAAYPRPQVFKELSVAGLLDTKSPAVLKVLWCSCTEGFRRFFGL
jgi:hypothetical protein